MSAPVPRAHAPQLPLARPQFALPALLERHLLLAASLVLNLVFAAGLYFAWSAVGELSRVREELTAFENVEARVSKRLDVFNTGLQSRLATSEMQFQQINEGVRDIRALVEGLRAEAQIDRQSRQLLARDVAVPPPDPEPIVIEAPTAARAVASGAEAAASAPQFKRVLQGNGKVTYQRVN